MPAALLDRLETETGQLAPEEQLELARRLLNRALVGPQGGARYEITDWYGMGRGTWKTGEDVARYIEEERNSWER